MPTDVQKNFKKQIREFQKQQKEKNRDKYYSYIEKDFISSYYEERKKRRKRIISGAGIISLLILFWNIYAGSTWINYLAYKIAGKPLISEGILERMTGVSFTEMFDRKASKRKAIYRYLDSIKDINIDTKSINALIRYAGNQEFSDVIAGRLEEIETQKNDVSKFFIRLNSIDVPTEMEGYHKALTRQIELFLEMAEMIAEAFGDDNLSLRESNLNIEERIRLLQEINTRSQAFNHYNRLGQQELIRAFEQVGIKYEIADDGIRYYRD